MKTNKLPPLEYLKECFVLDSSLPNGIRWVSDRPLSHLNSERMYKRGNKRYSNKPSGTLNSSGYYNLKVGKIRCFNHRIIFAIYNNTIDFQDFNIDHIDGNKLNNNPENLRLATNSQNQFNRAKSKNNTSGHKNVYFHKRNKKYFCKIKINNKDIHIGTFKTLELTIEARDKKAKEIAGIFYKS